MWNDGTFPMFVFYPWVGEVAVIVGPGLPPGAALPHHPCSADPLIVYYCPTGELLNVRLAPPLLPTLLSPGIISHCQRQQPSHQTLLLAQYTAHISLNESKCHPLFIVYLASSIHKTRWWSQNKSQNSNHFNISTEDKIRLDQIHMCKLRKC